MIFERWTTEYVEQEDRLRIAGEGLDQATAVVWLSRRMLERVLPLMTRWLEGQIADSQNATDLLQWEQQAAIAELRPQAPVNTDRQESSWVVSSIDVHREVSRLILDFKDDGTRAARIAMPAQVVRQWIGILYSLAEAAEWRLPVWPRWVYDESPAVTDARMRLH